MPELPEVEVLARSLRPLLVNRIIRSVDVRRRKIVRPGSPQTFARALSGATFTGVDRRGKCLLFHLRQRGRRSSFQLLGTSA